MPTAGRDLFSRFAYPPNELGYCGPVGTAVEDLAAHAKEFDGAWPYLDEIASAANAPEPLDPDVVQTYWIGGPLLDKIDSDALVARLRNSFAGQVTGLLSDLPDRCGAVAHHSFHVFVVYPWIRFLVHDPVTPLNVMQNCRIRWGVVDSVEHDHAVVVGNPLVYQSGLLALGAPTRQRVRWRQNGSALAPPPQPGRPVAAHWDWLCGGLTDSEVRALESATRATLRVVNAALDA